MLLFRILPRPSLVPVALATLVGTVGLTVLPPASAADGDQARVPVRLTADDALVRSAEVPVERGVQRLRTTSYSLVAATWRGPAPRISIRVPDEGGWQRLPVLEDVADTQQEGTAGVRGTDLLWTGEHSGIEVRVRGARARDVELVLIDPGSTPADEPRRTGRTAPARTDAETAPQPALRTRKDWGADNSWRNGRPQYLDRLKQVHLHHTATGNDYRRRDVPGIIRGMYRYHTKSLGWFDLGYNFVVDRFGHTWVGRSGGPARLVQGAHTLGFNHTSVAVAVIGNYQSRAPGKRVVRAVQRLAAWKLDMHDRRATGKVWVRSTGSDKYPEGRRVRLPAFDGHRDTNDTACPGDRLYAKLPRLRRITQRRIDRFS